MHQKPWNTEKATFGVCRAARYTATQRYTVLAGDTNGKYVFVPPATLLSSYCNNLLKHAVYNNVSARDEKHLLQILMT
jgi:hypothetical protein